tara:strand:- start:371 stop:664 length:294 start_codon:yes stop_codon:yes gene_type:complete
MMYNRFDLEECIMQAWNTEDEINLLLEDCVKDMPQEKYEETITGISRLHGARMTKLMEVFENIVETKQFIQDQLPLERTDQPPKVFSDGRGGLMQFS